MASFGLQTLICIFVTSYTSASRCERFYKGCCPGSSWNSSTEQCERCMPGYSGLNCSSPCPYPLYGVECQKSCNCNRDLCDVSTGCINNNKAQKRCITGYFGRDCRARCIYPYYGEECEAQCNCSESMCDVTTGCKAVDEGMIQMTTKKYKVFFPNLLL
ncbi:cell death abnormality protein 1-like [Crassostrea angulata]|uniref:cell death abnormality protein 1-like n=1 Tax=Magallana angulata TaxID=2784310 RepID=UPI0022B0F24E|nr:cell death abnormality protein 1-like [Crassostrea angulata]